MGRTTTMSHSQTISGLHASPDTPGTPLPDFVEVHERGLYDPSFEHDACGVGVVANVHGVKSHEIIEQGIKVLVNLGHRGACGCDPKTGDGAGILLQMPDAFFRKVTARQGLRLPSPGRYAVGMCFLPRDARLRALCEKAIEDPLRERGMKVLGWRDVPVDATAAGDDARAVMPAFRQVFVEAPEGVDAEHFERRLYIARKVAERGVSAMATASASDERALSREFYVSSLSSRTVVYKGLLMAAQIRQFYPDLAEPDIESAFALVHSRFSTNTLGSWKLAHPYRFICHNGEINTVRGNRNWMAARERSLKSWLLGADSDNLHPVCEPAASDTASLDNAFELLWMGGRSVEHAMSMLIPAAWYGHESMPREVKAFYEYHSGLMEPWDGPALVAFSDGQSLGAVLDRNGLRPFRYTVTRDGLLVMASETGVLDIAPERVLYKARLQPGRMFLINFEEGRIVEHEEVIAKLSRRQPYARWLEENRLQMDDLPRAKDVPHADLDTLVARQAAFGYSSEDLRLLMLPMAATGAEPVGSMGHDSPIAVLSDRPQLLFSYFQQHFAQVSNPPLDGIREELVTQISVPAGRRGGLFDETPEHCRLLRIDHPVLKNEDMARIKAADLPGVKPRLISTLFRATEGAAGMSKALDRIRREATQAVSDGCTLVVLSDRGVDGANAYVPSLLAVGAVHHHLIRERSRTLLDIIVESGEPREIHHFAALFGYGASAINPYLALESLAGIQKLPSAPGEPKLPSDLKEAEYNYCKAVEKGVLKVMSKMGISTMQGYLGAQIFEALGLDQNFIDEFFAWTPSRIGGIGINEITADVLANHGRAFPALDIPSNLSLDLGGLYLWRGTGERHMWNPDTISLLQDASKRNDARAFEQFEAAANTEGGGGTTIRGLLEFNNAPGDEIPLDQVEPAKEIVKRFATGAISLGSISREAHETLGIAMNRIGARSNTGEGGEDHRRYKPDPNGDNRSSRMKQVASGRFGVTANYLVNATDLQIKMAQGSKPGEGGQIPGHKVSEYIGEIRRTMPGVELISPPPHHDIYSIEDLAQLIHDLKNINPTARIHVKLVSEAGVGIIAAGVAKGKADVVLISGDSGGTGASPLSSIKHGGLPWELGLAETQQVLVENGLRSRIVVQTDGQIKTSRDVAVAALLGADEWGVATGALVTLGCIMLRKCHLNTCSVGIATQDEALRAKFAGTPEATVNYFMFLAEGLRKHMAKMGFRTVDEMVGRVDKLKQREGTAHFKAKSVDLSRMLLRRAAQRKGDTTHQSTTQEHGLEGALDHELIRVARPAINDGQHVSGAFAIRNSDRSVGAMLSGEIAKKYGEAYLPDGTVDFDFKGSAGQSFAAFLAKGVSFRLEGDSNDGFGKGLSGGRVVVVPPREATFSPDRNIIVGNVALYGATGGEAYIRGVAGERFCVRNSAAVAVVEGLGDHGCEYMTGGRVVVLGRTGRNFGAGMSGGIAYVYDEDGAFKSRFNPGMADLFDVVPGSADEKELKGLIQAHIRHTKSSLATGILGRWAVSLPKFRKVFPRDYARVLGEIAKREADARSAQHKVPAGAQDDQSAASRDESGGAHG